MYPTITHDPIRVSLTADPRGNYVTWASGKKQIRFALKHLGWKAVGTFRMRKENKNEFFIHAKDASGELHSVTVARKPGATLHFKSLER